MESRERNDDDEDDDGRETRGVLYIESRRAGPDAVTSQTDDGALVDVTRADEAVSQVVSTERSMEAR